MNINSVKTTLAIALGKDREKRELRKRVENLEIQAARLKEERDEARKERNALVTKLNMARATLGVST